MALNFPTLRIIFEIQTTNVENLKCGRLSAKTTQISMILYQMWNVFWQHQSSTLYQEIDSLGAWVWRWFHFVTTFQSPHLKPQIISNNERRSVCVNTWVGTSGHEWARVCNTATNKLLAGLIPEDCPDSGKTCGNRHFYICISLFLPASICSARQRIMGQPLVILCKIASKQFLSSVQCF